MGWKTKSGAELFLHSASTQAWAVAAYQSAQSSSLAPVVRAAVAEPDPSAPAQARAQPYVRCIVLQSCVSWLHQPFAIACRHEHSMYTAERCLYADELRQDSTACPHP